MPPRQNGFTITTTNVTAFKLALPGGATQPQTIDVDGQFVTARPRLTADGTASCTWKK